MGENNSERGGSHFDQKYLLGGWGAEEQLEITAKMRSVPRFTVKKHIFSLDLIN